MGIHYDAEFSVPAMRVARRIPGPVRGLFAEENRYGGLVLRWQPPVGNVWVEGYCVERTADGRSYEQIGIPHATEYTVEQTVPGEAWFYRVTAFNSRGHGKAKTVYFYRRAVRLRPRGPILRTMLFPIPVRLGMRLEIFELE